MDASETPSVSASKPEPRYCPNCESLQLHINLILVALLLLSGTFCAYLSWLAHAAYYDLQNIKGPATVAKQAFDNDRPKIDAFIAKLAEYGKAHPDFKPIIDKYKITLVQTTNSAVPPAPPAQ